MSISQKFRSPNWLSDRLPFYYGWVMVPIALIANAATSVGQTYGISIFNTSFQETLNLSLSQLTGAYMFGTLLAAIPQPYIGALIDRFGIRRMMTLSVIMLGLACIFTAQVNALWMLLIAFFLLRLFGQGALSLLAGNIPPMWFQKRLGMVAGILNMGVAGVIAIIPPFFLGLVNSFGWRNSYAILGILVWVLMFPLLILLFRNRPEDIQQQLDGSTDLETGITSGDAFGKNSLDLKAAQRTPAYWIMFVNTALWAMIATAIFFNIIPLFKSLGLTEAHAATTYSIFAIASAITQLIAGPIADRAPLNWLLVIGTSSLTASIFVLTIANAPWLGQLYAVFMGIAAGMIGIVGGTLWAKYYGRKHLGKIRGSVFTAGVAGSSLGPFIMGLIYDNLGSYQISLWIFIGLLIPVVISAFWATPPAEISPESHTGPDG